jgi:acetyl esterase/lipase
VRNVTVPTLTPFLPDPAVANGTGVIVCPGGGFQFLVIDKEGTDIARWLNARGVAALMLKYRLLPMPADDAAFRREIENRRHPGPLQDKFRQQTAPIRRLAIADGLQAMRVVRERAGEWGIQPDRLGIMGFSAGGQVAAGVALQYDSQTRPDFAAPIYGAPRDPVTVPSDAPPLFLAVANDDERAAQTTVALYSAWSAAGRSVELHVYSQGGHGFGLRQQGLPSDHWIDRFGEWLQIQRFLP